MDSLQKVMEQKFGDSVSWCGEDVAKSLEEHGHTVTAKKIQIVIDHCDKIKDSMIEAGWVHIDCIITDVCRRQLNEQDESAQELEND